MVPKGQLSNTHLNLINFLCVPVPVLFCVHAFFFPLFLNINSRLSHHLDLLGSFIHHHSTINAKLNYSVPFPCIHSKYHLYLVRLMTRIPLRISACHTI